MKPTLEDLEDLAAVILVPTEAFRKALIAADPSLEEDLAEAFGEPDSRTVILIPSPEDDAELEQFLTPHRRALATKELEFWIPDAARRPNVDESCFDQWFEVEFHSVVVSLGEED
ncbi:MAG: hypothetical protein IPK50_07125 [Fibrobacterota bacterium]|nr:hypothetical protein [Fibrobacterota bacterium]QQS06665.1 MAG: hypothetical protein IPK50_07125 [Fibrobacterota bacterium]